MRLSDAQIADVKARVDLGALARELGAGLRKSGRKLVGSCPVCGGGRSAQRFEVAGESWVCAVCQDGGDAIRLLQRATGCDFRAAVERLGGAREMSDAERAELEQRARERSEKREREAQRYRAREIAAVRRLWEGAARAPFEVVAAYLQWRRCLAPASAMLRFAPELCFFHGQAPDERGPMAPRVVHRGPAMLAAIVDNAGDFCGLHMTFLAPGGAGKAEIFDPETGEALIAKKCRGAVKGGHIVLRAVAAPRRLFIGEGIETVLSVATALKATRRLRGDDAFWSSVDLGNLGGAAAEAIDHPFLKHANGHRQRLPGPEPDRSARAIELPDSVEELVLLGDGDSERVLTETTLERARRRYERPGRVIRIACAPEGRDFNNVLTEG
ncbi:CHC2 zinc finger domain-containing protein [Methylosinus sp. Sm6]|uniref:DUF7146 domain-containing protein n=1 Tax=Methylosinus sp. Sm6 TaxID=2866948 RepID=UPI001C993154|nr:CHC2 zinc finger domain-containing protein [Methylosinus sp. Sm6]MBY6239830.1 DNA primase [Methylosinus sp. Sm6]